MKHAELPDGKLLEFPDETPDRVIQRTVRKQLGITELDIVADKLDGLAQNKVKLVEGTFEPLDKVTKTLVRALTDLNREQIVQNAHLANAMHGAAKTMGSYHDSAEKAFATSVKVLEKAVDRIAGVADKLSKVTEELAVTVAKASESSSAIVKSHNLMAQAFAEGLDKSLSEFAEVTAELINLRTSARLKKRAYRNADGSWTMEVVGSKPVH